MGWNSANIYFDVVVEKLQNHDIDSDIQYDVLKALAKELTDNDWDTLDESLEAFPSNKAVIRVMEEYDVYLPCTCKCCPHERNW
jgi:hypothetical protein